MTAIRRYEDWPTRLADYLQERMFQPFAWGSNDCCLFAATAVKVQTGVDPARGLRRYRSEAGAAKVLEGFDNSIEQLIRTRLAEKGFETVERNRAGRGDVALVRFRDLGGNWIEGAGIVDLGGTQVALPGIEKMILFPVSAAIAAWKI